MKIAEQRFATILRVRDHQEKLAQIELSSIQEQKERELEILNDLVETKNAAVGGLARLMRFRAIDLQTNSAYIQKLTHQLRKQVEKLDGIQHKEDGKRYELIEKSKSKRIIQKLEEKRRAEETIELNRKEQRLMDVLANRTQNRW